MKQHQIKTTIMRLSSVFFIALLLLTQVSFAQSIHGNYSFGVEKSGTGSPVILIPGLYCSGKVWDATVEHFKGSHTCYEITLPGFAGQPPIQTDSLLKTVAADITRFIVENKLDKPVLIGHSLGGFVSMEIAIANPGIIGKLIIVSSAPFLPALMMSPTITEDSAKKIGLNMKNSMKGLTPAQIGNYQRYALPTMIRDTTKVSGVTEMAVASDPPTQAEAMYELFGTDLRPAMKNISCPVLVLADWVAYKKYGATRESVYASYVDQYRLVKKVTIAINDSSYHFIMYDEPDWFYQQAGNFMDKN